MLFFAKAWRELHAYAAAELAEARGKDAENASATWGGLLKRFLHKTSYHVHALPATTMLCRRQHETTPLAGPDELDALLRGRGRP
jgi:hypothetical protein